MKKNVFVLSAIALIVIIGLVVYLDAAKTSESTTYTDDVSNWKEYKDEYVSFKYPDEWKLEELDDSAHEAVFRLTDPGAPPSDYQVLVFFVDNDEQYGSRFEKETEDQKRAIHQVQQIIKKGDLREFIRWQYNSDSCVDQNTYKVRCGLDHGEILHLNGKDGFIVLSGNDKVFYGSDVYFLANQKIIRIQIRDLSGFVLPELATTETNLFQLIEDRVYGKIFSTFAIVE